MPSPSAPDFVLGQITTSAALIVLAVGLSLAMVWTVVRLYAAWILRQRLDE